MIQRSGRRLGATLPDLLLTYGGALLVVAAAGWLTFLAARQNAVAARLVTHTHTVIDDVQNLRYAMSEVSAAVRGFLINGDERQLQTRDERLRFTAQLLQRLRVEVRDNPQQLQLLDQLQPEITQRLAVLDLTIAAYRRGGPVAVQQLARQSRTLSQPLRRMDALLARIELNERVLLEQRSRDDARRHANLRFTMLTFLACMLAVLAVLFARSRRIHKARAAAEADVELQRQFLESVVENIPHMLFIKEAGELTFTRINRSGEELLGLSRDRLVGRSDHDFFPRDMADRFIAMDREVLASGELRDVPAEPLQTPRGTRYLHTKKVPIFDVHGAPAFLLGISEDITERRAFEERLLQLNQRLERNSLQLEAANRELESFSYSISHDLRAPLRAMDGYAGLIEEDCATQLDDEGRRYLAAIRNGSRKMGMLIDDLLTFSRLNRQQLRHTTVNNRRLVDQAITDLCAAEPRCRAEVRIGELPDCSGDEVMLGRVWLNLLDNALKYSSKVGQPVVEVRGEQRDQEFIYLVRDNGVGFDMRYYDKLFNVFQRLHSESEYPGTGVGLANVQRIVSRHQGRVWGESIPGEGATFYFSLPVAGSATTLADDSG